jgi:hypothetical protein
MVIFAVDMSKGIVWTHVDMCWRPLILLARLFHRNTNSLPGTTD